MNNKYLSMNIQMVEDDVDGLLEPRRRDKNKRLQHSVKKKLIDYFEILHLVSPPTPPQPNPVHVRFKHSVFFGFQ